MSALKTDELRALAEAVKEWNSTDVWPHEDCQYTAVIEDIDEDGVQYPIAEINADTYGHDGESLALANFYAAANPAVVLGMLDRIAELEAQQALKPLTDEHETALSLLCGLHPCMTIDGPPMVVAERIFDAVIAERRELTETIKQMEGWLETMRNELRTAQRKPHGQPT